MGYLADRPMARSRLKRRSYGINAYVGPNGSGKSALMVYDTIPSLDAGRPVLSTVRLLDFRNPRPCPGGEYCDDPKGHNIVRYLWRLEETDQGPVAVPEPHDTGEVHLASHPYYVPLREWRDFMDWRDGDVLMDEVTGVASSREASNLPAPVANMLVQLRRKDIVLRWSAPSWGRADLIIRECTQAVHFVVGSVPKRRPTPPGEPPRLWSDKRLFYVRTFNPLYMDEFEAHRADYIPPEVFAWYWRPGSLLEDAYDTLDPVTSIGWVNDHGRCIECGGRKTPHRCNDDHGETGGLPRRVAARKRSGAAPDAGDPSPSLPIPLSALPPGHTLHTLEPSA